MENTGESKVHGEENHGGYGRLILIWFGLVALTGLTVALAGVNLGRWIIVSALTIASVKTLLVVNVFMHLQFEARIFRVFVTIAGLTLLIFFTLTFFDYAFY